MKGDAREAIAPNEYFETLLRIRRDQPRRFEREVSAGTQRRVQLYQETKARSSGGMGVRRKAAA
jgi:hypothetical protein